jgi:5'-methylthioadenosine phosphorylase
MGRLAVVLGSSATGPGGEAIVAAAAEHGAAVLQRHGEEYLLPHEIDHAANLAALAEQGCDRVLAIASVGALSEQLGVGSFVCPDDFIALHLGITSLGDERAHAVPGFDARWRSEVLAAWEEDEPALRDGGVYWQTIGPRFETRAEIRLIAAHADLVGMTIASECVIAGELGLRYAAICLVDNLANGIGARNLSIGELEEDREANVSRLRDALDAALPALIAEDG